MTFVNLFLSNGMNDKFFSVYCNSIYLESKIQTKTLFPLFSLVPQQKLLDGLKKPPVAHYSPSILTLSITGV